MLNAMSKDRWFLLCGKRKMTYCYSRILNIRHNKQLFRHNKSKRSGIINLNKSENEDLEYTLSDNFRQKKFRRTKFLTPRRNFDSFVRFFPDFCIDILDKIFDGQNISSDKIFDTKPKFRQFCPIFSEFCIDILDKMLRRTKFLTLG